MPIINAEAGYVHGFSSFSSQARVCYLIPLILGIPLLRVRCEWGYLEDSKKLEELVASMFSLRAIDCFSLFAKDLVSL